MTDQDKPDTPAKPEIKDPVIKVGDDEFMYDAGGRLVPISMVKPQDKLQDQTVRHILFYAEDLSGRIARFRGHTFDDVATFVETLAEQYDSHRGGQKGNVSLTSYDGTLKVVVQVQDQLTFGPELEAAKGLVDACIVSWAPGACDEYRALVEHAFQVDKEGRINRAALFQLRRLKIDDEQWAKAMQALGDAIRVIGSKEYVRFYKRTGPREKWQAVTIDLASA